MGDDKWTRKALRDDSIVVALLLQIKQQQQQHKSSTSSSLPPLRWGQRQLRSKASSSKDQRQTSPTRCSPTTPLSWSAASLSDGCDTSAARSKVCVHTHTHIFYINCQLQLDDVSSPDLTQPIRCALLRYLIFLKLFFNFCFQFIFSTKRNRYCSVSRVFLTDDDDFRG